MNQKALLFTALSICARFADLNAGPEEVAERKPGLFVYAFAEMLSGRLTRPVIGQALSGQQPAAPDYQL